MFRTYLCAFVAVVMMATPGFAQKAPKKKAGGGTAGQISAVDAAKGTVTVEVILKKNATERKTFKVTDKTTVTAVEGKKNKITLTADKVADLLKKEHFKVGAQVTIEPAEGNAETAKAITFTPAKGKKAGTLGQITAVDAAKGTLTVKVAVKKATEDKTFKVTDKTTVTIVEGKNKSPLTADKVADLLKKEQFKVGANVSIEAGEGEVAKAIVFVAAKKKKQQ